MLQTLKKKASKACMVIFIKYHNSENEKFLDITLKM
jgi:hypothetical protein